MTTIHYREILCDGCPDAEIIDEHMNFDLIHFADSCGQPTEWVLQLLEYDILPTRAIHTEEHIFLGEDLSRARQAYRLQRDFDASFSAVAMMLDLIDEVQKLRKQIRHANFE